MAAQLLWPIALFLSAVLALVAVTLYSASRSVETWSLNRQQEHLARALDNLQRDELRELRRIAADVATVDLDTPEGRIRFREVMAGQEAAPVHFDTVFVLRDGRAIAGLDHGADAGQGSLDALRPLLRRPLDAVAHPDASLREGTGWIVHHGGLTHSLLATLLPGAAAPPLAMVASNRLEPAELEAMGQHWGLRSLRTTDRRPKDESHALPIEDAAAGTSAYFVWKPALPVSSLRPRLIASFVAAGATAVVLFLVLMRYLRRMAAETLRASDRLDQAGQDPLSGLPNRLLFGVRLDQELSRIKRTSDGLAVLFLDLDRFKEINDAYGTAAGDTVIRVVAQRLSNLLRGADTLARFAGDEFAIIQTGVRDPQDAEALARRILDSLGKPIEVSGGSVTIAASIGIVLSPRNGTHRDTLMRLADTALYQAKNAGRNRYSFFERQMDEALRLRKLVEDDLRQAVAQNELILHYQPQVTIDGRTMVAVEALVRWPHPQQGLIPPDQFISVAEERGLIIPLGEWVLRRACEDAKRWPHLRIAVNVSAVQFRHPDFVGSVLRAIEQSGIDPARIELELTEGVVVEDADAAEAAMTQLRANGVRLALDDFGTGYSSLIYLRRFAFDKIKIDRSFLESAETTGESAILIHSIVHLGRALGLTVTAEGVESEEQLDFLRALGCHEVQGYLFSKPVPAEEIDRMIARQAMNGAARGRMRPAG